MDTRTTIEVSGMTCGHCENAVIQELSGLDGVHSVEVDLASGTVSVMSSGVLDPSAVSHAVESAGYQVVRP